MRVLGIDPGEHLGFAVIDDTKPVTSAMKVKRFPVLWMGATIEQAQAYISTNGMPDLVVIEDQYLGKAGPNAAFTLAQRSGYVIGALGIPPERVYYVKPVPWYRAIGMPNRCTKQVCMYRIQAALTPTERVVFEALCEQFPQQRLDIAAALGIAWSLPHLPAAAKKRKLVVFQRKEQQKPRLRSSKRPRPI